MKKLRKCFISTLAFATTLLGITSFALIKDGASAETVSYTIDTVDYQAEQGASVRVSDPTGLRFQATIPTEQYESLKEEYSVVTYGMFIVPASMHETTPVTEESVFGATATYTYRGDTTDTTGKTYIVNLTNSELPDHKDAAGNATGKKVFNGVIANINTNNYLLEFIGIPYLKATLANGTVDYRFVEKTDERSVVYVAQRAQEEGAADDAGVIADFVNSSTAKEASYTVNHVLGDTTVTETLTGGINTSVTPTAKTDGEFADAVPLWALPSGVVYANDKRVFDVEYYAPHVGLHKATVTENSSRELYNSGATAYRLMFDTNDTNVKDAVDRFNTVLNELTGNKIPYPGAVSQTEWDESKKYIIFDNQTMFEAAGLTMPNVDALGETGYYIATKGNSVFVMAGDHADRTQAFQGAVLALLERTIGYEMYAADCVSYSVKGSDTITLPDMEIIERPDVDFRNRGNYLSVGGGTYGMGYTNNSIFMSINGNVYHTSLDFLDPNEYYDSHSDWFYRYSQNDSIWDSIIGNQRYDHYQICYSTVDDSDINTSGSALNIMYNEVKAHVEANPTLENISFGTADNNYVCDCSNCKADVTTYGSNAGAYISVANKIAAKLRTDLPDRTVHLVAFAYRQYETAPTQNITIDENVGVMVAPIESNWSTALATQTDVVANIQAWAALTDNMYYWFYQTNFNHYFYPLNSWGVMQSNIQFAKANGAKFLFYQSAAEKNLSHFSKLKDYLEIELMKNSAADYDTLVNNFFTNYYGPAATEMKTYFNALQTHMNSLTSTGGYKEDIATTANWPQAKLQEFMGYINSAYKAVKASGSTSAATYNARIKLESIFPRFALLSLYSDTTTAGTANNFAMDCNALEMTNYNEGTLLSACDYSGWWNHTCSSYVEYAHDRCLVSGATEQSGAIYYKTCSACGAINANETFVSGSPLNHDTHTYTFEAGTGENEGYDVGTCFCGETVLVKTDYTDGTPIDIINGTEATLTMPEGFTGTVTGGNFGETLTFTGTTFDTTSIPQASHGLWTSINVTFTSEYGATHTAKVPVILITDVIDDVAELKAFTQAAHGANTAATAMHGYYILGADIDCDGASLATGGGGWNQGFFGTFDGRGHKISNMTAANQGGIFGRLAGTVKDVHFASVSFNANTALMGKITAGATFQNVTVDIASWVSVSSNMTYAGILGVSQNLNNNFDNFVINVAKGVSVSNLMGAQFSGTGDITVNLHGDATVVNYYTDASANAVTSADGTIITVNTIAYNEYTVSDEITAESGATLTITNAAFTDGATATIGTQSVTVSNHSVTFTVSGLTVGAKNDVIISIGTDTWTYNNVFCVTQIIDTVAELKALGAACKAANTTGYYILGGDIDCSAEANMAAGNPGWETNGFSGTFDGRGYTISNIKMTWDEATGGYGGLFGNLDGCTIKNVVFDKVNYASVNVALFGRHTYKTLGPDNTNITNVTVNVSNWAATGEAGVFVSRSSRNTLFNGCVINVADGVTVHNLLGQGFNSSYGSGITVNLGTGSSITSYYYADTSTAQTTPPSIVTVNAAKEPIDATLDTLVAGEGTTSVTFANSDFTAGTASVTINEQTKQVTASNGALSLDLADFGVSAMGQYSAVIELGVDKFTYTDVWYATQVIDTVAELKALGAACKAANTTGYYILGGDIDCSAEANMAVGNPGWQANGFSGTFDGRGYTISNIKMTWDEATGGHGGLFGNLAGCTIKNVVFDKVNYASANVALLGRHAYASGGNNVTLENLTVNVSAWGATGEAGLFVSRGTLNTLHNNCTVNIADGVTVHNLLGYEWKSNYGSGITVNLGTDSVITSYYYADTATAQTTPPSIVTVKNEE